MQSECSDPKRLVHLRLRLKVLFKTENGQLTPTELYM